MSPPYATQEDAYLGTSADSPLIRAQARAILDGGSPHSNAPQGHAGAQQGSTKQHVLHMRPGAEADQESSAQDADRANLVDESVSSRHTTTGFRPYANEASLQVSVHTLEACRVILGRLYPCRVHTEADVNQSISQTGC